MIRFFLAAALAMTFVPTLSHRAEASASTPLFAGPPSAGRHEILVQGGVASVPQHGLYGHGGFAFHDRGHSVVGWHVAAAAGPRDMFRGLSGGADVYFWRSVRLGGGLGLVFPLNKVGGNPILVPLPEASAGYHGGDGRLRYAVSVTQNLFLGTRATVGVGVGF